MIILDLLLFKTIFVLSVLQGGNCGTYNIIKIAG